MAPLFYRIMSPSGSSDGLQTDARGRTGDESNAPVFYWFFSSFYGNINDYNPEFDDINYINGYGWICPVSSGYQRISFTNNMMFDICGCGPEKSGSMAKLRISMAISIGKIIN